MQGAICCTRSWSISISIRPDCLLLKKIDVEFISRYNELAGKWGHEVGYINVYLWCISNDDLTIYRCGSLVTK
jgi:hypothetical protein